MNDELKKKGLVYVVDNSHLYQEIVKMVLEREGYSVRLFDDGYYVLKALNVHKAVRIRIPDLIICEMNMRIVDGPTLFNEIKKSNQHTNPIPFIFMTMCSDQETTAALQTMKCEVFDKSALLNPLVDTIQKVLPDFSKKKSNGISIPKKKPLTETGRTPTG